MSLGSELSARERVSGATCLQARCHGVHVVMEVLL